MPKKSKDSDASSQKQPKFILILSDGTYFADDENYDAPKFFDTIEEAKERIEILLGDGSNYDEEGFEILEVISRKIARQDRRVVIRLEDGVL